MPRMARSGPARLNLGRQYGKVKEEPRFKTRERPAPQRCRSQLGVFLQPALVLLVGIEVVEDDVKLAIREGTNEAVHEAEELDPATPLGMRRDDPAGGDFERRE